MVLDSGRDMDGSSNSTGLGVGLILTSPKEDVAEYTLHFKFPATNNETKYEALIAGIKMAKSKSVISRSLVTPN